MCVSFEMKNSWSWAPSEGTLATVGNPLAKIPGIKMTRPQTRASRSGQPDKNNITESRLLGNLIRAVRW